MSFLKKTIILLLISQTALADCPKDVQIIKAGDKANCDGFLFSKEAEQQAEQDRDDLSFYKIIYAAQTHKVDSLVDENNVLQKRLDLYIQESKTLSQEKARSETTETFIRIGYFTLGVFVTALVARNVQR